MSTVEDVKDRLDIVDVVSGYVSLQKAGRNYKARCPFHTEKTPSFSVNPERQSWYCFGACATGGDVFTFVMRAEELEFGDALRSLAQKAGIELEQRQSGRQDDAVYRINQESSKFYQDVLASDQGRQARDYLAERKVGAEIASKFEIGLSPRGRDALRDHLLGLGFEADDAVKAGVLRRQEDGPLRDFFWARLMFPIWDRRGRVAGFGGRSLDGSDPKYINTPATSAFDKQSTLYALHKAVDSIKELDTAIIVEGYMDVIAAHEHGYTNVVASMGTALTERQVQQLKSLAKNFVQALDPDAAGQEATLRSLESSWRIFDRQQVGNRGRSVGPIHHRESLELRVASLPPGRDPDTLIREDPEEWERLTENAAPFMEFLIPAVASRYDLSKGEGKARAAEAVLPLIHDTANAFDQEKYFGLLAAELGVSRAELEASVGGPRRPDRRWREPRRAQDPTRATSASPLSASREYLLEEYILALLLSQPELRESTGSLTPQQFRNTANREVFTSWLSCTTMEELRDNLEESLHAHLDHLDRVGFAPTDHRAARAALEQCLARLEARYLQDLQEARLTSEDSALPPPRELEDEIVEVNSRLKELFSQRT